ncbi:MAG: TRAP transporter substrate-binding protein [Peptoniphilus sp.]|uniref:TRAP transporter substrate-binding protein n=1 Tax=Peptoniphilus sp. TaxID=1971214 RepID=UPI002A7575AD|nr:TRAP transporter substrate-binding protein [Peptoniphilus sp.]MDY2987840.1 TRAP transporter substrate-binding protein [Peptoniphilus sp.]
MKKKFYLITLMLLLALSVVACGDKKEKNDGEIKTANTDSVVIKIGHVEPENRSTHRALVDFKDSVEEKSKGAITVEIYPNGALGGDVQLTESVAMGTLDAALPSTSVLTTYSNEFGVLDMPYLFTSSQSAFDALDGEIGDYFNKKLEENGIINLGYSYNGPRSTTSNVKTIEKPEDLKGLKMRVMESPIFIDYYKTLGANPTPMSFTELYTGLQQGTVEAQENPPSLTFANKFYEVQKYSSIDEHVHNFLAFIMNKAKYDSLTPEQQQILMNAAKEYVSNQRKMELEDNEKAIKDLEQEGKLVTNILSTEQKQKFKEALTPMYEKYKSEFGEELFKMSEKYNETK